MAVLTHDYYCPNIGMASEFRIVMPNSLLSNDQTINSVIFLLSPEGESGLNWVTSTKLSALCDKYQTAAILVPCLQGCYTNMKYGYRFYDSLKFVSEYIDTYIPGIDINNCDTAIAGISIGGLAAIRWAAEAPDFIHAAASFSGKLDPSKLCDSWFTEKRLTCLYGTSEQQDQFHNGILSLLKETPQSRFYLFACENDTGFQSAVEAKEVLGGKAEFDKKPGASNWKTWSDELGSFMKWWKEGTN